MFVKFYVEGENENEVQVKTHETAHSSQAKSIFGVE